MQDAIRNREDLSFRLTNLLSLDPTLRSVFEAVEDVPLRLRSRGLPGLCEIIIAQMVSKASAAAITRRFHDQFPHLSASVLLDADEGLFRQSGLSGPKIRTLKSVADALKSGALDFDMLVDKGGEEALSCLTRIKGIGPWTAEVYLMFCEGHPDLFPAGDLALRIAVEQAFSLPERPSEKTLRGMALRWQPYRSVAARLFWAYYQVIKQDRDVIPV